MRQKHPFLVIYNNSSNNSSNNNNNNKQKYKKNKTKQNKMKQPLFFRDFWTLQNHILPTFLLATNHWQLLDTHGQFCTVDCFLLTQVDLDIMPTLINGLELMEWMPLKCQIPLSTYETLRELNIGGVQRI